MIAEDTHGVTARRQAWFWGAVFFISTFGIGIGGMLFAPGNGVAIGLLAGAMLLLIPFTRAMNRYQLVSGNGSDAQRRYNQRFMIASLAYVVIVIVSIWLTKIATYPLPVYVAIAVAPALPILAMIWIMARLLVEEQDEYLRARHVHHALVATGFALSVTTVWGFLDQFKIVPHVPPYLVLPLWAVGLAISQCWSKFRP